MAGSYTSKCQVFVSVTNHCKSHGLILLLICYVDEAKRNVLGSYVALYYPNTSYSTE